MRPLLPFAGMIPDIALMIAVYGGASLVIRALNQHRAGTGTLAQASVILVWLFALGAAGVLVFLGLDVLNIASSTTSTVPGLTAR